MKVSNFEWSALISMFETASDGAQAKALFEMWLDEKYAAVFKEGWLEACEHYDVKYDGYLDDDAEDSGDLIYDGY